MLCEKVAIEQDRDLLLDIYVSGPYASFQINNRQVVEIGQCNRNHIRNDALDLSAIERIERQTLKDYNTNTASSPVSRIIVNKSSGFVTIQSDRFGSNRLYLLRSKSKWIISNKLYCLISQSKNVFALDPIGFSEAFRFRWITGDHSLIRNIQQISLGNTWRLDLSNRVVSKSHIKPISLKRAFKPKPISLAANELEELLLKSIDRNVPKNSKCAVLLSGGVDSSVLAALSNTCMDGLFAVSALCKGHVNPEIETAKQFAQELGIKHYIVEVSDETVPKAFENCTKIAEQPIRNQSSLLLYSIFDRINQSCDCILYGEGADTFLGSNSVKRGSARFKKYRIMKKWTRLFPFLKYIIEPLPKDNKFRRLLNENLRTLLCDYQKLEYSYRTQLLLDKHIPPYDYGIFSKLVGADDITINQLQGDFEARIMQHILWSDVANHFHETDSIASHFGLKLCSPYMDKGVMDYGLSLNQDLYIAQEYVKPTLRCVGENFFSPNLMYLKKQGFPAPYREWLGGPLKMLVNQALRFYNLREEDTDNDYELQWTLACFYILAEYLNTEFNLTPESYSGFGEAEPHHI